MHPIHVFDTYAKSEKGKIMHFDVIIAEKDPAQALACARDWLKRIGEGNAVVNQENCCYCHSEASAPTDMQTEIETSGYAIYKLEGCP